MIKMFACNDRYGRIDRSFMEYYIMDGVSERTFLAVNCPISFIKSKTDGGSVGGYRDAMIERGIIPQSRKNETPLYSYKEHEREILEAVLRYEYADLMIRVRHGRIQ